MRTFLLIPTAAVAAAALLSACSSSSGTTASVPATAPVTSVGSPPATAGATAGQSPLITIDSFQFSGNLTVRAGQRVSVTNRDTAAHTLTDKVTHLFDTGNIAAGGGTATFTAPAKPGTYPFGCDYHPEMAGVLTVTG